MSDISTDHTYAERFASCGVRDMVAMEVYFHVRQPSTSELLVQTASSSDEQSQRYLSQVRLVTAGMSAGQRIDLMP